MPFHPRHRDLTLATLLLLSSLIGAVLAYASILRTETPELVFLSGLNSGEQHSNIRQNEKCVGTLSTTLTHNSTYELKAGGEIRSSYSGKRSQATISVYGYFNPLGQLSDASILVAAQDAQLEIIARETNPLKIRLHAKVRERIFEHKLEIPGPLLIKKSGQNYQLEYSHLPSSQQSLFRTVSSAFPSDLNFHIAAEPGSQCAEADAIELSGIISSVRSFLAPFSSFIPGIEEIAQ